MEARRIELYHPDVNGGNVVSMVVQMTEICCSPPDHTGRRTMDYIDIVVPLRSDERRLLHEFGEAITRCLTPMRLVAGNYVGGWSIERHTFEGETVRYSLFHSGSPPVPPPVKPSA